MSHWLPLRAVSCVVMAPPTVAVIIAALDERDTIEAVLEVALRSDRVTEVIVADGGSDDGTLDAVARFAGADDRVRLIHNPHGHQSGGLNLAARLATADLLVRLDAHTDYADDYLPRSIGSWEPDRAVGGPMRAQGDGPWPEAIANAMDDPWAIGPARFRHADHVEEVDTVYLGTFARHAFLDVGGYRRFPSGTVEDADFYARWRARGWRVVVDPAIRSVYHPRRSWRALWRQYRRYGEGKAELLWANGRLPSARALAPAALVAGLGVGTVVAVTVWPGAFAVVAVPWLAVLTGIGVRAPSHRLRTAAASATMHAAYGVGTWLGVAKGRPDITTPGFDVDPSGLEMDVAGAGPDSPPTA